MIVWIAQAPPKEMPKDFKGIPLLELEWKVNQGDPKAMVDLAWKYYRGEGTHRDVPRAIKLIRRAANKDYAEAKLQLGLFYGVGDGVPHDPNQARRWVDEAARQELPMAQYVLGTYYETGFGVPGKGPQIHIAYEWFRRSAELGCAAAMVKLGQYAVEGKVGPKDKAQACVWLRMASDLRAGSFSYNLARMEAELSPDDQTRVAAQLKQLRAKWLPESPVGAPH